MSIQTKFVIQVGVGASDAIGIDDTNEIRISYGVAISGSVTYTVQHSLDGITYFDNPDMFKVHLATWHTYSRKIKKLIDFIVIDDCSKVPLKLERANLNLTILKVIDDIIWNLLGARNLGADYCKTDWFLMTDTDMLLPANEAVKLLKLSKNDSNVIWDLDHIDVISTKRGTNANQVFISKELFWRCWGYDEDFSGNYGHEDSYFNHCLYRHEIKQVISSVILDVNQTFSDSSTIHDRDTSVNIELFNSKIKKYKLI